MNSKADIIKDEICEKNLSTKSKKKLNLSNNNGFSIKGESGS
jgi:hypothetical protein